jgi:hypothetical protein
MKLFTSQSDELNGNEPLAIEFRGGGRPQGVFRAQIRDLYWSNG